MGSKLILHCGSREVTRAELGLVEPPASTRSWKPAKHSLYLELCESILESHGYRVERERIGLSQDNHSFFGALDLATRLVPGTTLCVGVRSNTSKKFPFGFAAGSRCFVCDNMAMSSELFVRHRHSTHGIERMRGLIESAMPSLGQFREAESRRIAFMQVTHLPQFEAEAWQIEAFRLGLISSKVLPQVIECWRNPPHEWGAGTLWHLYNAFTTPLQPMARSNPSRFLATTMELARLIFPKGEIGFDALEARGDLGYIPDEEPLDVEFREEEWP